MTSRRGALGLLGAVAVAVAAAGCSVRIGDGPDHRSPVHRRFDETQRVDLDLRRPLDRGSAGIDAGTNSTIIERRPDTMLDVDLLLPGPARLRVPAIGVAISCSPHFGAVPPEVDPEQIVVNRIENDLEAAGVALRADAAVLGLAPGAVDDFVESAHRDPGRSSLEFPAHDLDDLYVQVGVRGRVERVQINYTLLWGDYAREVRAFAASAPAPSGR